MAEEEKNSETKVPWTSEINEGKLSEFAAELGKDIPSKGNFLEDYAEIVETKELVVGCPLFQSTDSSVRLANVAIDLPSWRAMLLAISTAGSTVKELAFHACTLETQHIVDLISTLEKMGLMEVVKLDYTILKLRDAEDLVSTLLPLFSSEKMMIKYLSLKGCNLGDEFACSDGLYKHLSENVALTSLNLANNRFTDVGVSKLVKALRVSPMISEVSLAQNGCEGECFSDLMGILSGVPVSAEEEASLKAIGTLLGDKNKAIKDANKTRKKKGYSDLPEVSAPPERVVKIEDENFIANRALKTVDLSFCPFSAATLDQGMKILRESKISEPPLNTTLVLRGRSSDLLGSLPVASPEAAAVDDAVENARQGVGSIEGLNICY